MIGFDECNDENASSGCVVVFVQPPREQDPTEYAMSGQSIPTSRQWVHCMRNLAASDASFRRTGSIRKPMIERLLSAILSSPDQRTDYTYARTISYLPPDLASPTADKQKPNMKRNAIRRGQSIYSAATSTSHYEGSEGDNISLRSMQRQSTIPASSNNYESIYESALKNTSTAHSVCHPSCHDRTTKSGNIIRTAISVLKWLFIPGCFALLALAWVLIHGQVWTDSTVHKVIRDRIDAVYRGHNKDNTDYERLRRDVDQLANRLDRLLVIAQNNRPLRNDISSKGEQCCSEMMRRYDNDRTGMLDFAHTSMGGQIYSVECTKAFKTSLFSRSSVDPNIILKSDILPGNCWPFKGTNGSIVIRIAHTINPFAMTYEHIDQAISLYKDNAPFIFSVIAWNVEVGPTEKFDLGTFHFYWNETKIQTFYFQNVSSNASMNAFDVHVRDNWGNTEQTCLYRIRIHGHA